MIGPTHEFYVFVFGVAYLVFLKILEPFATLIFQVKARLPCTTDRDIAI